MPSANIYHYILHKYTLWFKVFSCQLADEKKALSQPEESFFGKQSSLDVSAT